MEALGDRIRGSRLFVGAMAAPLVALADDQARVAFFLGLNPQLRTTEILFDTAQDERCKITTMSVGVITVSIDVILRNFDFHKVEW